MSRFADLFTQTVAEQSSEVVEVDVDTQVTEEVVDVVLPKAKTTTTHKKNRK
jgi:hypothetical protein